MAGRVKVELSFPRNVLYLRVLKAWRQRDVDSRRTLSYFNAKQSIQKYPSELKGIDDLKRLSGVGDVIASRLEECWKLFEYEEPEAAKRVSLVKELLTDERAFALIEASRKGNHRGRVPDPKNVPSTSSCKVVKRTSSQMASSSIDDEFVEKDDEVSVPHPKFARHNSAPSMPQFRVPANPSISSISSADKSAESDENEESVDYVTITPRDRAEVILIMDMAEKNGLAKRTSVVEHLEKKDIRVERRRLSVGDYMWIARLIDGREMCMDWVVERKTWTDLDSSIKKSRYEEQKQRLRAAPFINRVYLVEGHRVGQSHLEQALTTTMTHDNFLIQRTSSCHKSAEFLHSLTLRLREKVLQTKMTNVSFESVQRLAKKSAGIERVSDVWLRMLMVVPGMSSQSASMVAERFSSLPALLKLFRESTEAEKRLTAELPSLGKVVVSNIAVFFNEARR